jgi:hypothetical protein
VSIFKVVLFEVVPEVMRKDPPTLTCPPLITKLETAWAVWVKLLVIFQIPALFTITVTFGPKLNVAKLIG